MKPKKVIRRLAVISHVIHYRYQDQLWAFGPYAREIDIWADLVPEIVITAPCRDEVAPGDCVPFMRSNITIEPVPETGGKSLLAKIKQLVILPRIVVGLIRTIRRVDAVHVRCPGNLGLLGTVLAPLFVRFCVAKYAGQWNGYLGEPWSIRLQRRLLRSHWWGSPVTVYGQWPNQPPHVIPFFTSMMTNEQVAHSAAIAVDKCITLPLRVLYAGRVTKGKRVDALLQAVEIALKDGRTLEVTIVGDGPERPNLQRLASELGIQDCITFVGALPFEEALKRYEWAHCLVLPSLSEGWPKVVAEGMCHGLACIAVDHGQVSSMLTGRGILLKTGSAQEIADALQSIAEDPHRFRSTMRRASLWAQQFSIEGLREALSELLREQWDVPFDSPSAPTVTRRANEEVFTCCLR